MASVRRALVLSISERYLLIALSLASNILLARLLTPEEIGLYSVSIALIGIAQVLREFGIGNYLIQVKTLTDDHIRTAFGFSLVIGASLFVIIYLIAPFAGSFYNDERVVDTIRISALNFLVLPFCSISLSLLRREMMFKRLVLINLIATIVGFIVTITLAYRGVGANSMAIGALMTNIATGIGTWAARGDFRLLLPSFVAWRELMSFGARTSAANIITSISMDINDLAVGRILGFSQVAFISKAQGLMNLFHRDIMNAIRNVAYPAFARSHREGLDLEPQHTYGVTILTVFAWPFYAFTAFNSTEIIQVMFGSQWTVSAPLVPWFCLAGCIASTCNLIVPLLTAKNRIDLAVKIDFITQPIRAAILIGGVIYFQSMESFAILFLLTTILSAPYIYHIKNSCQKTEITPLFKGLTHSALITALSAATIPASRHLILTMGISSEFLTIIISGSIFTAAWILSIKLTKHPIALEPAFLKITSFNTSNLNKPKNNEFKIKKAYLRNFIFSTMTILEDKKLPGSWKTRNLLKKITSNTQGTNNIICSTSHKLYIAISPNNDEGIDKSIYQTGSYELGTQYILESILKPGDRFIDIGANVGLMSLVAAKTVGPTGRVDSYEPIPEIASLFSESIRINKFKNINLHRLAIGSISSTMAIYKHPEVNKGSASLAWTSSTENAVETEIKTLDNIAFLDTKKPISMIKIDVEGWEFEVLKGADKILSSDEKPNLCIEFSLLHPLQGGTHREMYEFLSERGYIGYVLESSKSSKSLLIEVSSDALPTHDNIFFFPRKNIESISGYIKAQYNTKHQN